MIKIVTTFTFYWYKLNVITSSSLKLRNDFENSWSTCESFFISTPWPSWSIPDDVLLCFLWLFSLSNFLELFFGLFSWSNFLGLFLGLFSVSNLELTDGLARPVVYMFCKAYSFVAMNWKQRKKQKLFYAYIFFMWIKTNIFIHFHTIQK